MLNDLEALKKIGTSQASLELALKMLRGYLKSELGRQNPHDPAMGRNVKHMLPQETARQFYEFCVRNDFLEDMVSLEEYLKYKVDIMSKMESHKPLKKDNKKDKQGKAFKQKGEEADVMSDEEEKTQDPSTSESDCDCTNGCHRCMTDGGGAFAHTGAMRKKKKGRRIQRNDG